MSMPESPRFRYSELFAGIGGFRVALDHLGGECVFACEIEPQARKSYEQNFPSPPGCPLSADVCAVDAKKVPDHDLLCGGFPCQPFSREGKQPGVEGKSGGLFREIVRILDEKRPALFLLENVPGLLTAQDGKAVAEVRSALEGAGYAVKMEVLDSAAVLPQVRRRVYICGFRRDLGDADSFSFPVLPSLKRGVGEILEEEGDVCRRSRLTDQQWRKRLTVGAAELFWAREEDPFPTLTRNYRRAPGAASGKRFSEVGLKGDTMEGNEGGRAGWRNVVKAGEDGARFLTPRECARVQGFPEGFVLPLKGDPSGPSAALFGNAVSPPVVAAVAEQMLSWMESVRPPPAKRRPIDGSALPLWGSLLLNSGPPARRDALCSRLTG
eukprot:Hpha_TRINITY_DN17231_c0_g1::TRINITY_DN17231_c0_g1_i1::g.17816::m.17816/K00558/DNMT1, dcm; DNA (cytosine-5)-methyltransferase 1